MGKQEQLAIPGSAEFEKPLPPQSPMDLLSLALQNNAAIDVIERLATLQEKAQAKIAEDEFNLALTAVQSEIPAIIPNKQVKTRNGELMYSYSSYEALDKVLRPLYLRHGFSLSFKGAECPADRVRVICRCSHRGGHTETYQLDLAIDPGKAGLSRTDAELAANSKAKRRILRNIFNVVDDTEDETLTNGELMEAIEKILDAGDVSVMMHYYKEAYKAFESNPDAIKAIAQAKVKRQKELQSASR